MRSLAAWTSLAGRAAASARIGGARRAASSSSSTSSSPPPPIVGFVGLGAMGGLMAANLARAGFGLVACDASPSARTALEGRLGKDSRARLAFAPTPAALASTPALAAVFTSLPSLAALRAVWLGHDGLLSPAAASSSLTAPLLVDLSTSGPAASRELAAAAAGTRLAPGVAPLAGALGPHPLTLDAPVSGGVRAAASGTLTFLVGGPDAALAAARPFLEAMGSRTFHVSPTPGSGQAAKLANNAALAVQMAGLCEALTVGAAASGVDPGRLLAAINASTGRCWASEAYPPVPGCVGLDGAPVPASDGRYRGGFAARLMLKDLGLAAEGVAEGAAAKGAPEDASGTAATAALPMATAAAGVYGRLVEVAGPDIDFAGVYKFVYGGAAAREGGGRGVGE